MSAPEALPSPYLAEDPPTSSGRTLLATAFAHYCALMWGYSPEEVARALSDEIDGSLRESREIRLAARLIGRVVADGGLRTFARPIGGGEPISLKPSVWELDDFTDRFASSAMAVSKPFDRSAETTHWIFVETADFDVMIDDATADLPRNGSRRIPVSEASIKGEEPSSGPDRLIRLPEVMHLTGMSRSTVYARMGQGRFPNTVSMVGIAAWRESDVREWLNGPR